MNDNTPIPDHERLAQLQAMRKEVDDEIQKLTQISEVLESESAWPRQGDKYVVVVACNKGFCTESVVWADDEIDRGYREVGNFFPTEEAAQPLAEALNTALREFKHVTD